MRQKTTPVALNYYLKKKREYHHGIAISAILGHRVAEIIKDQPHTRQLLAYTVVICCWGETCFAVRARASLLVLAAAHGCTVAQMYLNTRLAEARIMRIKNS
jgi:hypothetical protein